MALFQRINLGSFSNDGTGDKLKQAGEKINDAWDTLEVILDKPISDAQAAISAANSAASSASAASSSQTAAAGSASAAATSATNAGNSATAASGSATSASTSAGTATTQAGIATTQAGTATTQAGIATTQAGNASASAASAGTSATLSQDWAVKTTALVGGIDYSAKEFAIGTQSGTGGSSKNWAQQTGADVTGAAVNSRSAKSWSQDSLLGATLGGSAKDWAIYISGTVDGTNYSAKYNANLAATSATNAATSATNAATSETNALAAATRLTGTSATSVLIATGSKVFTTQSGKDFNVGSTVKIVSGANSANYFFGDVTAYSGTSLTVNVTAIGGSGTYADWTIQGRTGLQGIPAAGSGDFVGPASSTLDYIVTFGDTTGKLGKNSGKLIPSGAVVGTTDTQTLTNKTLTSPAIATIVNTGTLTLPTSTDTMVGRATTDTLTNKTLDAATNSLTGFGAAGSDVITATNTTKFVTSKAVADSHAWFTLTSGATPAWNTASGYNARIVLGTNATFAAPTNLVDGRTYSLLIVQDATGSRTGAFNSIWDFGGAGAPTLSTTANSRDLVVGIYDATTTKLIANFRKGT